MALSTQQVAYVCIGIGVIGIVGSFAGGGGLLSLVGGLFALVGTVGAIAFWKYGYVLFPLITTMAKVVQVTDTGYEIPPSQDVILKNVGGIYYASKFLGVRIYESVSEKSPEEQTSYAEYFERAVSSVKFVVKFSYLVYVKDMTEYRNRIETKRAEAQLRLSREREKPEPDVLKLDRYERETAMWESALNRLIGGVKPMGATAYIMTTATGVSKESATAAAKSQANELKSTISNALNVEVVELTGEEMLRCFDWEHVIPPTAADLEQAIA